MPSSFPAGAEPETWKHSLSGPSPSLTASETGAHKSPWSLPGLTQVMEWKQACGSSGRNGSPGKAPVSPSSSSDSTVIRGGTRPTRSSTTRSGNRLSGCWSPVCPNGPWSFQDFSQNHCLGLGPPQRRSAGRWSHGWLAPNKGRPWDLPPQLLLEPPCDPPTCAASTCRHWAFGHACLCVYLLPLIPDSLADPVASVSGESWLEKDASVLA